MVAPHDADADDPDAQHVRHAAFHRLHHIGTDTPITPH
jgi:hypothetical protein